MKVYHRTREREAILSVVDRDHAPGEARLLRDVRFTAEQRRHVNGLLDAREEGR
jgi:hypothetical protein